MRAEFDYSYGRVWGVVLGRIRRVRTAAAGLGLCAAVGQGVQ